MECIPPASDARDRLNVCMEPFRRSSVTNSLRVYRGSDTPTIYVGDIDMYIPLENLIPSHANCMQHVLRCWERQSEGSEIRIQENPSVAGAPPRTPLGELTAPPQTPLKLVGRGWLSPPQELHPPSSALGPSGLGPSASPLLPQVQN